MIKRKLFSAYTDSIAKALKDPLILNESFQKSHRGEPLSTFTGSAPRTISLSSQLPGLDAEIGIQPLKNLLGITKTVQPSFGDHPDFKHLRHTGGSERHYIVSCFIDVKKSTSLFKNYKDYNHDQIAAVIQTIQAAAIHTCSLFNGHIQRLQYDGLFVYFGGKSYTKEQAIEDSIKASSFFSYFIKYELPDIFIEQGMEEINTRIGIDFGDTDTVSWYVFGVNDCSELTSLSLHTSLAPKMQANATENGMVIGANLVSKITSLGQFTSIITDNIGNENRYVYYDPHYTQYKFDWQSYLVSNFSFVKKDGSEIYIDYDFDHLGKPILKTSAVLNEASDQALFNIAKKSTPWYHG